MTMVTRQFLRPLLVATIALLLSACETIPTHIDGRKVIGTKVVDGQTAYIVQSSTGDVIVTKAMAAESRAASRGMVFKGTKSAPETKR